MTASRIKVARVLAINLALIVIVVIGVELAFGNWSLPYIPPQSVFIDRTFHYRQSLYDPPGEVVYRRDRYALRGVREPLDEIQVVTLGGSTTDQKFITEGLTWQDVIRAQLKVPIANAGVDGMSSTGHITALREWLHRLPNFSPRYYLHYIGLNDTLISRSPLVGDRSGQGSWIWVIRRRSAIVRTYNLMRTTVQGAEVVVHRQIPPSEWGTYPLVAVAVDEAPIRAFIEAAYRPNLNAILDLHAAKSERAIIVSQPIHPWLVERSGDRLFTRLPSYAQAVVGIGMVNAASEQACRERSDVCRFVDLARKLDFLPEDFYDEVHATPPGAHRIGTFLAQELARLRKEWP